MSNISSVKDVGAMQNGDPILRMLVTVKDAFPAKTGNNEYGDWAVQAATVVDSEGQAIRASFWNPARDIRQLKGNTIDIVSGKDGKGKFSGITAYDYEDRKKGTITRQIKVSEDAIINEVIKGESGASGEPQKNHLRLPSCTPDERSISIEKQVALKAAVDLFQSDPQNIDEIIKIAHRFYNEFFAPQQPKPEPKTTEAPAEDEGKVI